MIIGWPVHLVSLQSYSPFYSFCMILSFKLYSIFCPKLLFFSPKSYFSFFETGDKVIGDKGIGDMRTGDMGTCDKEIWEKRPSPSPNPFS